MENKNYGFIIEEPKKEDYILGSKQLPKIVLQPDGQWGDCLPVFEAQRKKIETMACVSFSALNCLETLHYKLLGIAYNRSDRFTAKMSGTNPYKGNSMRNVAESVRKHGTVEEKLWDYEYIENLSTYYKTIPDSIIQKGKDWLKEYNVGYEWIYDSGLSIAQKQDRLIEALQYSPIQVAVYAYGKQKGGIYIEEGRNANHAVVIYGYKKGEYWKIFDSYKNEFKKFAWNYNFKYAMRFNLTKINKPMFKLVKLENSSAVYFVDADNNKHLFKNKGAFVSYMGNNAWDLIETVSENQLFMYKDGVDFDIRKIQLFDFITNIFKK